MKTLKILWLAYSIIGLVVIIIALFVPQTVIFNNTPTCYSIKEFGKECFMCGSTRSFIQAGKGNFSKAISFNKLAFTLFILISINTIIFTISLLTNLKKRYT